MDTINKDKTKMKHFRKWTEGKNPFLAATALMIAGYSKECFELFKLVEKGKRIEGDIPLPSIKTWLKLYHNHQRVGKVLLNAWGNNNADAAKETDFLKTMSEESRQLQKMTSEQLNREWGKIPLHDRKKIIEEVYRKREEFIEYCINDFANETNEAERKEFLKNLTKPEFIFIFRVLVPCFSIYHTHPLELLNKAQNGDDEALEKLIRLDKSIIFEPKISEIVHQAQVLKKQERISMIKKAFRSKPNIKMDMKTIKCNLGGLISNLSIGINQKITAVDIRNLFDAISLDMNDDIDNDLGDMVGESFEKAIQRSRNFWHIILPAKK